MGYDVAIINAPEQGSRANLSLWEADGLGAGLTGPLRVAQAWAIEFMTQRGSRRFKPASGSAFMALITAGRIRNDVDARTYFLYAAGQVADYLRSREDPAADPSDRFGSAQLERVVVSPGFLAFVVRIATAAGTARTITLPLPSIARG
ncbi:MAG: hypothetical protein E6Q97_26685 [Desulfurellales bacterium]|nr:MAG: hypothetical protein E6Q97_26685 [Desulfurellales bacterium]